MGDYTTIEAAGRQVRLSNPGKVFFAQLGLTKLDLAHYYLRLAEPVCRALHDRPTVLKRYVDGAGAEPFFQKRIPESAPDWLATASVTFPSGRTARELVPNDAAHLIWAVNLGVIDFHPWAVRLPDLEHPDELRVDLDPTSQASFDDVRRVAACAGEVLREHGLQGYPKTSGSRGIHIAARILPEHGFEEVRSAAVALAREVARRLPELASTSWWKEERHGVFIDYNQNARDRTLASAYSVRPTPDARVSTPFAWEELGQIDPAQLRIDTVARRLDERGDPAAGIDESAGSLGPLLARAAADREAGLADPPWPPHFRKRRGERPRVAPSRARRKTS